MWVKNGAHGARLRVEVADGVGFGSRFGMEDKLAKRIDAVLEELAFATTEATSKNEARRARSNCKQGKWSPVWGLMAVIMIVAGIAVCYNAVKDISVGDVLEQAGSPDPPTPHVSDQQSESGRLVVLRVEPEGDESAVLELENVSWSVSAEQVARDLRSGLEDNLGVGVTVKVLKGGEDEIPDIGAEPMPLPTCPDLAEQFYPGTCGLVDSINEGEPISDLDIILGGLEQYQPYQSCGGSAEACLSP